MNKTQFIHHQNATLSFSPIGNPESDKVFIAFHGFGLNRFLFRQAAEQSDALYYAIDLFAHNDSQWLADDFSDAPATVEYLYKKLIQVLDLKSFRVVAYSIGARACYPLLKLFRPQIDEVILIAPDGIYDNPWYALLTRTNIGKYALSAYEKHAWLGKSAIRWAHKLRLLDSLTYQYIYPRISSDNFRKKIRTTWMAYSSFSLEDKELEILSNKTRIVLASKDNLILQDKIEARLHKLGVEVKALEILEANHNNLITRFLKGGLQD